MRTLQEYWRRLRPGVFTVVALLASAVPAGAQDDNGGGAGPWVLPYALVLLGIGLGLMMVLGPGKRRDRPHPERYEAPEDSS